MTSRDEGEIRSYYKGHPAYVPFWFHIYTASGENPLEAQRMEAELTEEWWQYHQVAQRNKARAQKQMRRK